jgi:hypothetical protein
MRLILLALAWAPLALASDGCGDATLCASFERSTTSLGTPKPNQMTTDGGLRWWVGNKGHDALDTTRIALVDFGRDGSSALKITTQNDDRCVESGSCNAHTFERAEISLDPGPGPTTGAVDGAEQWWAHSVYFPPEFQIRTGPGAQAVVLQFHNGGRQPAIVLEVYNQLGSNRWKVFRARAQGPGGSDLAGTQYRYTPPGAGKQAGQCIHDNVAEGVWYDFVHHLKWSSNGQGFHRIWMREGPGPVRKVLDQSGISTLYAPGDRNGRPYAYLKLGLYHSPIVAGETEGERLAKGRFGSYLAPVAPGVSSVVHDRVRRGTTFAAVAPPDFKMPPGGLVLCNGASPSSATGIDSAAHVAR